MELTGKARIVFEEYFLNLNICDPEGFCTWTDAMQWGVLQDFFDTKGLEVCVDRCVDDNLRFINAFDWVVLNVHTGENYGGGEIENTRPEARKAAIEKANEIYNSQP